MRTVIGFSGLIGCGKSTCAHYLMRLGFQRRPFAGPIKEMGRVIGLSEAQLNGSEKEVPCVLLGSKTPRQFMQLLGTEFGRHMICDDFWVRAWRQGIDIKNEDGRVTQIWDIVADDVRFPNEVAAIHEMSGEVVRVTRPGLIRQAHESEKNDLLCNYDIRNDGSVEDLHFKINDVLKRIMEKQE